MRKSTLLRNIIVIVVLALAVLTGLSTLLLSIIGKGVYAQQKADEIIPRAESIARELVSAVERNTPPMELRRNLLEKGLIVSGSPVYMFDVNGDGISTESKESEYDEGIILIKKYFNRVISGERVCLTSTNMGVFVGVPAANSRGNIIGAVFIITPVAEVQNTLNRLTYDLGVAFLLAAIVLMIPVYLVSRNLTNPIKNTAETALKMASGDLSVRAEEKGSSEGIHLARSFNTLADNLQITIDNLTIEKNKLRTVLDGIGEGIISTNRSGVIELSNSMAVTLLGGREGDNLASLEPYSEVVSCIVQSLATSQEYSEDIKVGDTIIRCSANPLYDGSDSCGTVVLLRDITESERLEKTRRDYVANVSHELRTPLASIRSLADALADDMVTSEEDKKRYYGYIQRESIRLSHLISDLLELSRLQSGNVAFTKRNMDLYETLFDVADRMEESARERGKHIVLAVPESEYIACSNEDRVEQVLIALIDNAIKHGDDGCEIMVDMCFDEAKNRYTISVSNPAADVSSEDLAHLFDRFYKADRAHTGEGTGIGLSIVSEVLNLLDESIWVDYSNGVISFSFTVEGEAKETEAEQDD